MNVEITISHEHTEYQWLEFGSATKILKYDNNRNALWELDERLHRMRGGQPWRLG